MKRTYMFIIKWYIQNWLQCVMVLIYQYQWWYWFVSTITNTWIVIFRQNKVFHGWHNTLFNVLHCFHYSWEGDCTLQNAELRISEEQSSNTDNSGPCLLSSRWMSKWCKFCCCPAHATIYRNNKSICIEGNLHFKNKSRRFFARA